jgi:hypothetical protein
MKRTILLMSLLIVIISASVANAATLRSQPAKVEGFGLFLGINSAALEMSVTPSKLVLNSNGAQIEAGLSYTIPIGKDLYFEASATLLSTKGYFRDNLFGIDLEFTSNPVCANLKMQASEGLLIGGGVNYSFWDVSLKGITSPSVTSGIGYQFFVDILEISTELGYMVKKGSISEKNPIGTDDVKFDLTSTCYYAKYKMYF